MKNIFLFVFTFFSFSIFAQSNEFMISYQSINRPNDVLKSDPINGMAMSFYRNTSNKSALGIKINANQYRQPGYSSRFRSVGLDATSRRTFLQRHKIRVMGEFGISIFRNYTELISYEEMVNNHIEDGFFFCGTGLESSFRGTKFKEDHPDQKWYKSDHYGLTSAVSIDYTIKSKFIIGASYSYGFYRTTKENVVNKKSRRSNISINLGIKI